MGKYHASEEQKKQFASLYILNAMVNDKIVIPVYLEGNDEDLEPVLEYLMARQYITIKDNESYETDAKGYEVLKRFMARYSEFLKIFDVYCAVDLGEGRFAFQEYFDLSDAEWESHLNDERWEDLRVAVAEFKELNPVEIVFMSFLKEGQFGDRGNGWQFDLLLGSVWDEILDICNSALSVSDLGYTDEDGDYIEGASVLEDVIAQGAELNLELHKHEESLRNSADCKAECDDLSDDMSDDDGEYETHVTEVEYTVYESYYDPFYISPVWALILFI